MSKDPKTRRRLLRADGKQYACIGGEVRCRDGDKHFIPGNHLPHLYGVQPRECIIFSNVMDYARRGHGMNLNGLVILRPREDGDYTIPDS